LITARALPKTPLEELTEREGGSLFAISVTTNTKTISHNGRLKKGKLHHSWPPMITITNKCKQYNKNNNNNKQKNRQIMQPK